MRKTLLKRKKPMKRGTKRLGPGKKTLARKASMGDAIGAYFQEHGWDNSDGEREAYCQISHVFMAQHEAVAHHKTPRAELRKEGVADLDAPERLIICHWKAHKWIHGARGKQDWQTGRPKGYEEARQFAVVEQSPAHAGNSLAVEFGAQDFYDLAIYMEGRQ